MIWNLQTNSFINFLFDYRDVVRFQNEFETLSYDQILFEFFASFVYHRFVIFFQNIRFIFIITVNSHALRWLNKQMIENSIDVTRLSFKKWNNIQRVMNFDDEIEKQTLRMIKKKSIKFSNLKKKYRIDFENTRVDLLECSCAFLSNMLSQITTQIYFANYFINSWSFVRKCFRFKHHHESSFFQWVFVFIFIQTSHILSFLEKHRISWFFEIIESNKIIVICRYCIKCFDQKHRTRHFRIRFENDFMMWNKRHNSKKLCIIEKNAERESILDRRVVIDTFIYIATMRT